MEDSLSGFSLELFKIIFMNTSTAIVRMDCVNFKIKTIHPALRDIFNKIKKYCNKMKKLPF